MYYEGRRPGDPETQPEDLVRFRVKSVKFRKPPSVQELRNRAGVDDMLGTAANPIAVMQVCLSPGAAFRHIALKPQLTL